MIVEKPGGKASTATAEFIAFLTPGAGGMGRDAGFLTCAITTGTRAREGGRGGLYGECSTAHGRSTATITPGEDGMVRDDGVFIGVFTTGTSALGGRGAGG